MGDGVWRVRFDRGILGQLRDLARNRQDHPGGCVRSRMSAAARGRARRADGVAAEDPGTEAETDGAQRKTSRGLTTNESISPENQMERILTRWMDIPDLRRLDVYVGNGGYTALRKALFDISPEQIINQVKNSNLPGRGRTAFTTGVKGSFVPKQSNNPAFPCCPAHQRH